MVATLAPRISADHRRAADRRRAGGSELELVSQLAYPLPVRIISELLGVPPGDSRQVRRAGRRARALGPAQLRRLDPAERLAADQASLEFGEYFTELIAARRAVPADDLLTKLIKAEDDGDRLTVDELIATCVLLLVGGPRDHGRADLERDARAARGTLASSPPLVADPTSPSQRGRGDAAV